jgi:hypothetical protein
LFLQFQLGFIFFQKFSQFAGDIEQTLPLLVIKRDRKTAQPVDADPAFFADPKFQTSGAAWLLFELRQAGFELFIRRFLHDHDLNPQETIRRPIQ